MKHFILFKKTVDFLLFLILFVSFSECVQAQTENSTPKPDFVPKSPEAAAFLKYGEYPVDLSTGVPGISIPLYTIDIKDFKLPISLDYHASGIKVNQEATWVGLGWNLNAGAQVILSPRDEIDENNPYVDEVPDADGIINYFKLHPYKHEAIASISPELDRSRVKDIYVFSSPTVNGSFYIKNFSSNEVVTIPPDAFKVELGGQDRSDLTFKITDKQGNVYTLNTTETSVRAMTHSDYYISAWYVDEIKTPSNNTINFVYQSDGVLTDKSFSQRIDITKKSTYGARCISPVTTNMVGEVIDEKSNTETTLKKIKEIYFNDGKSRVLFTKNMGRQDLLNGATNGYLSKIEIQQLAFDGFESIKGYTFGYSYFSTGSTYNDKRLKLDRIVNLFGESEEEFIYSSLSLPEKTSKGQDYFGYNNGLSNLDLIPKHYLSAPYPTEVGKADRSVSISAIQAGILKEIHYRTKCWTKFNYENNQFYGPDIFKKYVPVIVNSSVVQGTGGTVPVKEGPGIDEEPVCLNTNPADCVNYVSIPYEASNAAGVLTFELDKPEGDHPTLLKYHYAKVRVFSGSNEVYNSGSLVGQPYNISLSLPQSGTIEIEVYGQYYSVKNLQLKYVNNDATAKNNLGAGLRIKNIENYDNNNSLAFKKEFDYSDITNPSRTSGKLINEMTTTFSTKTFTNYNYYTCDVEGALCMPGVNSQGTYSISSNSRFGIEGNSIVYQYVKEKQVDVKNQSNNGFTQFEFTTGGDEIPLGSPAVQISTTWKRGKVLSKKTYKTVGTTNYIVEEEKNTYFEDKSKTSFYIGFKLFRNSTTNIRENASDPFTPACPYFLDGGIEVLQSIEPIDFRVPLFWYYQKTSQKTSYFYDSSNALTGKLENTVTFNYNNPLHLQLSSQTNINSKGEVLESKYFYAGDSEVTGQPFVIELQTSNRVGIPLKTQTFKGGAKVSEQLTSYDKSTSTSNLLLPKSVYSNKGAAGIDISSDRKITYDLYDDKGNVLQYTPESGMPVSIVWGYNKSQPIAKIENLTYNAISAEIIANLQSLSTSDNDNCISENCVEQKLRNALNLFRDAFSDAFISTYTYNPLVGVTSVTDPKGFSSYYEYDKEGRLKFVKDRDLNVLQKYCYNYMGQTIDCGDNTSGSVVMYKSAAQSGSFTKNNCASGGNGSVVNYSQAEGVVTSTVSQAEANTLGLAKFQIDGQAYANTNGYCTYYSSAQSGPFRKNDCAAGGAGSAVIYSQPAGIVTSTVSQADADMQGYSKFIMDGQSYANATGYCTYYSVAQSGSFNKNNCAVGGDGSAVGYSQPAGTITSAVSQTDADAQGYSKFMIDGQFYANSNGYCTYYSVAQSASFTKNNCTAGGSGSMVGYSQAAGALTSVISQVDADAQGYSKFINDGQSYANTNGYCTYYSIAQSGTFTKNNCTVGGTPSSVSYSQAVGAVTSAISQADADVLGLSKFNTDGQAYANANANCTFYSVAINGSSTKKNCPAGGSGSTVAYSQPAGAMISTNSQAEADALALSKFYADVQINANNNGYCTFYSVAQSGSFIKNNCPTAATGSSVVYNQQVGAITSTISQADADALGFAKFNADGQAYANANGYCTYYSASQNGSFTKNNCASGGFGSSVSYTQPAGFMTSTSSQADADALGLYFFNANGQSYANTNGYCTFYSSAQYGTFTKNNCPAGGAGSSVAYGQNWGALASTISQADADALGYSKFIADGQANANANGYCTYYSIAQSGTFTKNNCPAGGTGSSIVYNQAAGVITSTASQADADGLGYSKFMSDGQTYANANANCTFYNAAISQTFYRNNCPANTDPGTFTYSVPYGTYSSNFSQAKADQQAQNAIDTYGQNAANYEASCTFFSVAKSGIFTRNNCGVNYTGGTATYSVGYGAYTSTVSQADADNMASVSFYSNGQAYANAYATCTPIPQPVTFTYESLFSAITKQLYLDIYASTGTHAGATLYFDIIYVRTVGTQQSTQSAIVTVEANASGKTAVIPINGKSIVSVTLTNVVRN
ncbi:DUF5977 domain-containing protein [Flavobacterium olei]|uniref:DUF5977 domain-containing protein n=1 Tax=Flavobacterium olei TaxID=1886782 RepID=UPI00321A0C98